MAEQINDLNMGIDPDPKFRSNQLYIVEVSEIYTRAFLIRAESQSEAEKRAEHWYQLKYRPGNNNHDERILDYYAGCESHARPLITLEAANELSKFLREIHS